MCSSWLRIVSGLAATAVFAALLMGQSGCRMAADGHNLEGVRLYQQGQYYPALQQFQKAVATNPQNPDAYYNLAATLHHMGSQKGDREMLSQAETLYNQCLDIDENHTDCRRGLAVLLVESGRTDRAFALLKNWTTASPNIADARVELARLYEESGDLEAAKLHLNQAVMIDQQSHRAWAALGRIRERVGEYEQALANYRRAWNLNSFQPGVAERIASLSRTVSGGVDAATRGDTRTVVTPSPGLR